MTLKEFMEDDRYGIMDENALFCHGGRGGQFSRRLACADWMLSRDNPLGFKAVYDVVDGMVGTLDAEYLDLANRVSNGDKDAEAKAQRMVDEAAKRAGLMGPLWTGSAYTNITKFNEPETGIFFTPQENVALAYSKMHGRTNGGTYKVFLRVNNIKHVDFNGKEWFDYQADPENSDTYLQARLAKQQGFDAVLFTNIGEDQQQEWVVFFSAQIKSVDPVIRDEHGNVIPLSDRFNEASDDIRFKLPGVEMDADGLTKAG